MRNVVMYIAISLDGYIADINGNINWLKGDGSEPNSNGTYHGFIETIDTIILGYKTYYQIIHKLSPNNWPYEGKKTYVMTHRNNVESVSNDIEFTSENIDKLIGKLKKDEGKDIWVCGGANVINKVLDNNLFDIISITIAPTMIGEGIPLFYKRKLHIDLNLESVISYNGFVDLTYTRRW